MYGAMGSWMYTEQDRQEQEQYTVEQIWAAVKPFLDGAKLDEDERGKAVIKFCRTGTWYTLKVEKE